jgi:hypothetical protein
MLGYQPDIRTAQIPSKVQLKSCCLGGVAPKDAAASAVQQQHGVEQRCSTSVDSSLSKIRTKAARKLAPQALRGLDLPGCLELCAFFGFLIQQPLEPTQCLFVCVRRSAKKA